MNCPVDELGLEKLMGRWSLGVGDELNLTRQMGNQEKIRDTKSNS